MIASFQAVTDCYCRLYRQRRCASRWIQQQQQQQRVVVAEMLSRGRILPPAGCDVVHHSLIGASSRHQFDSHLRSRDTLPRRTPLSIV